MKRSSESSVASDLHGKCPRTDDLCLNETLISSEYKSLLNDKWKNGQTHDLPECQLFQEPFCHCIIPTFLQGKDCINSLQEELSDVDYSRKDNDLYKFHQSTQDLQTADSAQIKNLRQLLCTTFRDWLTEVCGIPLNDNVSMFSAKYMHTDTLLCHDDELEGRRIAFIYYLVSSSWSKEDGGALDLFAVDDNIQPTNVVKSIIPQRNSLMFFEVSPGSYHQVAEILSEDKIRWSIGGWFHGPPIERPAPYLEPARPLLPYGSVDDEVFFEWINPIYLTPHAQGSIQEQFEEESEIELQDFIQADKFKALLSELKSTEISWQKRGPPNKRHYQHANQPCLPDTVKECVELFQSDAMFLLLSNLTGLKLHELAGSSSEEDSESEETGRKQGTKEVPASTAGESSTSDKTDESQGNETNNALAENSKETESHPVRDGDNDGIRIIGKHCASKCRLEVRHWSQGCYTMAHDTDTEGSEFALDLIYYAGCHDWQEDYGGFTSYIAKDEDEELLTVTPRENSLALVYRDKESQRFVKHVNSDVKHMDNKGFFDISAVYFEK